MAQIQDNFYTSTQASTLRMTSLQWLTLPPVAAGFCWAIFDTLHISTTLLWPILYTSLAIGLFGFILSFLPFKLKFYPSLENRRVLALVGYYAFGIFPILVSFSVMGTLFFFVVPTTSMLDLIVRIFIGLIIVVLVARDVNAFRQRVIKKRFIEKEFTVDETEILFRRPPKTKLDAPPITNETFYGRLYNKHGSKLALLVFSGYPLQRLFADTAGAPGVLFGMAMLALPLSVYMLMRLGCSFYLYVYTIIKLERKHGKPVNFGF